MLHTCHPRSGRILPGPGLAVRATCPPHRHRLQTGCRRAGPRRDHGPASGGPGLRRREAVFPGRHAHLLRSAETRCRSMSIPNTRARWRRPFCSCPARCPTRACASAATALRPGNARLFRLQQHLCSRHEPDDRRAPRPEAHQRPEPAARPAFRLQQRIPEPPGRLDRLGQGLRSVRPARGDGARPDVPGHPRGQARHHRRLLDRRRPQEVRPDLARRRSQVLSGVPGRSRSFVGNWTTRPSRSSKNWPTR